MRKNQRVNVLAIDHVYAHAVLRQANMTKCPFCLADLKRGAVVCRNCDARRGFHMFGPMPDRPVIAWIKGLILPALAVMGSLVAWLYKPSPIWLAAAGFALFVAALGVRRLIEGSRWFHF